MPRMLLFTLLGAILTPGGHGALAGRSGHDNRDRLRSPEAAFAGRGLSREALALAQPSDWAEPERARPSVLAVPACRLVARWSVEEGRLCQRWHPAGVPPEQEPARLSWAELSLASSVAENAVGAVPLLVSAAAGPVLTG